MGQFILYAEQQVATQPDAASAAAIQGALQNVITYQDNSCNITVGGSWVGSPRITRQASADILSPLNPTTRTTRVSWLFQYPDGGASDAAIQNCVKSIADLYLVQTGAGWQPSQIISYNPATNGSVDWWTSGQAAQTATKDAFNLNQQRGGTSTIENPTGPQSVPPPADLGIPGVSADTGSTLVTLAYVAAGVAVLYLLSPIIASIGSNTMRRPARAVANPTRRSKRMRNHERKYHLVVVRVHPKTGEQLDDKEVRMTATPVTHKEAMTIMSKFTPYRSRKSRFHTSMRLREV